MTTRVATAAALACVASSGCIQPGDAPATESTAQPVEYANSLNAPGSTGSYFAVNAKPTHPFERASGTLYVPLLDARGVQRSVPYPVGAAFVPPHPLEQTCGVTFVSNSYAVTAAHCVNQQQVPNPETQWFTVRLYAPGSPFNWQSELYPTGSTYPNYNRPQSTFAGNNSTTYSCRVVQRCGWEHGTPINCADSTHDQGDVAVLQCQGQPGCDFDTVDVAKTEIDGGMVDMAWAHEVYDVGQYTDLWWHYSVFQPDSFEQNWHFFTNEHIYLPLISTLWPRPTPGIEVDGVTTLCSSRPGPPNLPTNFVASGTPRVLLEPAVTQHGQYSRDVRWTELFACQDTGGAGVVQYTPRVGAHRLVGPVSHGTVSMAGRLQNIPLLCHDGAQTDCTPEHNHGLAVTRLAHTRYAVGQAVNDFGSVCRGELPKLDLWLTAGARRVTEVALGAVVPEEWPAPWPCTACSEWDQLRLYNEPMLRVAPGGRLTIPGSSFTAGARYRVTVRARTLGSTAPLVTLRVGTQVVASAVRPAAAAGESAGLVSAMFTALASGAQPLEIAAATGSGEFGATDIAVVRDGAANGFDSRSDRSGVGYLPATSGARLAPVRVVAGRASRYAAYLERGERLVLTREALLAGRGLWMVSFQTSARVTSGVTCGFIFADGTESSTPCDAVDGRAVARLVPAASAQPLAFYVRLPSTQTQLAIDDLEISAAP